MVFIGYKPTAGIWWWSGWWFGRWLPWIMTFHSVGNAIIPTDSDFSEGLVGIPPTRLLLTIISHILTFFPHLPGEGCLDSPPPPPTPPHPPPPSPPPPSPPASPPPPVHPLPCSLPPCQLFTKLFANFRTQWALLDLNCKGLSALGTAGPQPGTFRAQGPSELSEHR